MFGLNDKTPLIFKLFNPFAKPKVETPPERPDDFRVKSDQELLKLDAQIRYLQKQQRKNKTSP